MAKEKNNTTKKVVVKDKKKIAKQVLIPLASVIVLGGAALGIGLKHEDIKSWFNHQRTYSYSELQEELKKNNNSWETKLKNMIENNNYLRNQFDTLTKEKLESDAKLKNIQLELNQLKGTSSARIEELESALQQEQTKNTNLQNQITSLNAQITALEQQIAMYEEIINQYENNQTAPVSFYDGETLIKATLVSKGSTYSLDNTLLPQNNDTREFVGFAVDSEVVNHNEYIINTATVFRAVFKYKVTYIVNEEETSSMILQGTSLNTNAPEVTPGTNKEFAGWVDEEGNVVNTTNTNVTKSITLTATFNTVYTLTFNYNDTSSVVRIVNGELESSIPTVEVDNNHKHVGWTSNETGYVSNSNLKSITQNATLIPKLIQKKSIKIKYRVGSGAFITYEPEENYYELYCAYLLNGNGDVQEYFLVEPNISNVINHIAQLNGKSAPNYKCLSLIENQTPYLYSSSFNNGNTAAGTSSEVVYLYLTLQ